MTDYVVLALLALVTTFSFGMAIRGMRRRRRIERMGARLGLRRWSWETDDEYSDRCLSFMLTYVVPPSDGGGYLQ